MAKKYDDSSISTDIDETDGEKTGISAQRRVHSDPHFDPDVKLVSLEQTERSAYIEKIGHAAWHREIDDRTNEDRIPRQVAGISALAVDDGVSNDNANKALDKSNPGPAVKS
jgi:hypothetical protein